jgi:hypothetical protein
VIRRYFIAYFAAVALDAIDDAGYQEWRETYWTEGPGKNIDVIEYVRGNKLIKRPAQHKRPPISRLKDEGVTLRDIFKFARAKGYINQRSSRNHGRTSEQNSGAETEQVTAQNLSIRTPLLLVPRDKILSQVNLLASPTLARFRAVEIRAREAGSRRLQ